MTGPYYLAIDGGGTNTRARLADTGGRIIGEGLSGSSNLTLGIETAGAAIAAAGDAAMKAAGLGERRARAFMLAWAWRGRMFRALPKPLAASPSAIARWQLPPTQFQPASAPMAAMMVVSSSSAPAHRDWLWWVARALPLAVGGLPFPMTLPGLFSAAPLCGPPFSPSMLCVRL